jgi:hypothetical protein
MLHNNSIHKWWQNLWTSWKLTTKLVNTELNIQNQGCIWLRQLSTYMGMCNHHELEPCCDIASYNNTNWDSNLQKK